MRYTTDWEKEFFSRPLQEVLGLYTQVVAATLGRKNPPIDHIVKLHAKKYLPLAIYSILEGQEVPYGYPVFVIHGTDPEIPWLTNFVESVMSAELWGASTSASIAKIYRKIFIDAAKAFGHTDTGFVDWQGHDFSFRGMMGLEAACISGLGHLTAFNGTDTIPAILEAAQYYGAGIGCGGSVPATEHSVMCAGGKETEYETFKRLITQVYPTGIVSIVSDTWDLWNVTDVILPKLKEEILSRDGKVVIRPDSGDPIEISLKAAAKLKDGWGVDGNGMLAGGKLGLIYGDAITLERAKAITAGLVAMGVSPFNMVFGIGSYTYQYVTRDTFGWALKATAIETANGVEAIFKDPVTDTGGKKSHVGIPCTWMDPADAGAYMLTETLDPQDLSKCSFHLVYKDGKLCKFQTFDDIRKRVRS